MTSSDNGHMNSSGGSSSSSGGAGEVAAEATADVTA
eukprot:CAMPEP_0119468692 /NCGR_PEP_ID=MMETSP1344-20130328/2338_1 /TAXON_ID=236787 /ORGANISM="Florenciella parvula, Strain CCMP2471" /LENGTH=35 /DNA_ID= /DNA_START= /DNA_END= /DNA_ORIENTATION=